MLRNTLYLTDRFHVAVRFLLVLRKKHASHKTLAVWSPKGGVMVPGIPCVDAEKLGLRVLVLSCARHS